MAQEIFFGYGVFEELPRVLRKYGAMKVLLVTGRGSYEISGAKAYVEALLGEFDLNRFCDFTVNPKLEDVRKGVKVLREGASDLVVAIGGGTVMDIAKLIRVLAAQEGDPEAYIRKKFPMKNVRQQRLIVVPTTAGSGSEVTTFGVVYIDGTKYSLDHPFLLPDCAIVDPYLTWSMPVWLTASTGLDVLSQAIESYWCVRSTTESREYAAAALRLVLENLEAARERPSRESRGNMSLAAMLAGKAINISRTTAAHTVSYPITALFGVPHGQACGLTLPRFILYNSEVTAADILDQRGVEFARERLGEILQVLHVRTPEAGCERITGLMRNIGLETRLSELGISRKQIDVIVARDCNPERVNNNPRLVP